ncbi:MAG TPA: hypothetical protein VKB86_17705 [Pyrinomonadaceae bacterium]|nr:hypothetical protein [Pyrinomonadaceae bacterium]
MKRYYFSIILGTILAIGSFAFVLPATSFAQSSGTGGQSATQSGGTQGGSTQVTTSTTKSEAGGVSINPTWIVIGAVALLVIILLIVLAARGGGGGGSNVHESKTVVKEK